MILYWIRTRFEFELIWLVIHRSLSDDENDERMSPEDDADVDGDDVIMPLRNYHY